jgi:hypothetical protein
MIDKKRESFVQIAGSNHCVEIAHGSGPLGFIQPDYTVAIVAMEKSDPKRSTS